VKRGFRYGSSNRDGAFPETGAVRPDDIAATMYALMGIDPETLMYDAFGRPLAITSGAPITGIMAWAGLRPVVKSATLAKICIPSPGSMNRFEKNHRGFLDSLPQ